ncbi:hypothetical protein [Paenibacillus sp. SAFN-117]|uniref:hypothetical protein n=1 Tax=Paenibacillus sp. SAFN-117 TaxID=3436860 RepID=UPI003F7EBE0B
MGNYFLYHYYEAENGPFKNLSALPYDEARKVMEKVKQEGTVFASRRSDDYLTVRRQLEERARTLFIDKGGKPEKLYPHYMTLGRCEWLKSWYKEGRVLQIPLEEFDPETISFTYGDLFPTMRYKDGKPYREKIYLQDEIKELIEQFGWPQEWNREGNKGPERYIEVQIWVDKVVGKFL